MFRLAARVIFVRSAVDTDSICMTFSTFVATSPDAYRSQFADGRMNILRVVDLCHPHLRPRVIRLSANVPVTED